MQKRRLQLFFFARPPFTLFQHFSHSTCCWLVRYCIRSAKSLESFVESPLDGLLYWLIEHEREKRHSSQTKLFKVAVRCVHTSIAKTETYPDRSIGSYRRVLCTLQCLPRIPYDTVNRESGQSHRRYALENGPLHHHAPEVLDGWDMAGLWSINLRRCRLPRICRSYGNDSWHTWMLYTLISQVGFVALVPYVSNEVCPGDTIRSFDEPWMSDWAERLSNI